MLSHMRYGSINLHSGKLLNNIVEVCSKTVAWSRDLCVISLTIALEKGNIDYV